MSFLLNLLIRQRRREQDIIDAVPTDLTHPPATRRPPSDHDSPSDLVSRSSYSSTLGVVHELEGDLWADHPENEPSVVIQPEGAPEPEPPPGQPAPNIIPEPEPPPSPNISQPSNTSEGASPAPAPAEEPRRSCRIQEQQRTSEPQQHQSEWNREPGGRLRRHNFASMSPDQFNSAKAHMSRKDRKQYEVSLGAKKPPRACRLSRKKMKYRQRRKRKQEIGDAMLNAMHFC